MSRTEKMDALDSALRSRRAKEGPGKNVLGSPFTPTRPKKLATPSARPARGSSKVTPGDSGTRTTQRARELYSSRTSGGRGRSDSKAKGTAREDISFDPAESLLKVLSGDHSHGLQQEQVYQLLAGFNATTNARLAHVALNRSFLSLSDAALSHQARLENATIGGDQEAARIHRQAMEMICGRMERTKAEIAISGDVLERVDARIERLLEQRISQ
ncbi:hypothetical protein L486_03975 [Kwoniella mangroviensis CBS 10435]|uniref:Uncharacterized protein n=1 Tax=Kwoniella mangroviensis CBS 10435 TaxID=1331196 RepID=A0A1B9IQZ7_9TREE|nr:hypothetical protein L486_03975 [Kwoniella mangroviensis CBS 10435]